MEYGLMAFTYRWLMLPTLLMLVLQFEDFPIEVSSNETRCEILTQQLPSSSNAKSQTTA
jgi:hypothetical protein